MPSSPSDSFAERVASLFHAALEIGLEGRSAFLEGACAGDEGLRTTVENLLEAMAEVESDPAWSAGAIANEAAAAADDRSRCYQLFLDAADLPPGAQREFLERECGVDTELAQCVEALLAADRDNVSSAGWLEPPSNGNALPSGNVLGPYRVLGMLGRGGMGSVYLAKRADGQDDQQVALKLINAGIFNSELRSRFLRERQVLATLDHPAIARLLDAGITAEDQPYLVLEYIEGVPIDRYCKERGLGISERLRLFLQVCAAVQEAHRKLVIHRDIKPANILVTAMGQPKLLDFGIAKNLGPGEQEQDAQQPYDTSRTALVFTPNYASPEQIGGKAIGVSTDVYSLGVLLYELLSGVLPLATDSATFLEAARLVQEQDPRPPSEVTSDPGRRTALRGDLDTIVLCALRKDPAQRYSSVDSLAADIERYLDGFPVHARDNAFRYRVGKFIGRHRAWVAVASVLLVIVAGSVAAIVRSARIAGQQRTLAERRFGDLRELANSYVYELDGQLEGIPGTTKVRALMAKRSMHYLDRLAAESAGDIALQRDTANGYAKLAAVLGVPTSANLGDPKGARESIEKALRMRRTILAGKPDSVEDHRMLASNLIQKGMLCVDTGDVAAAFAAHKQALQEADWVLAQSPNPTGKQLNVAQSAAMRLGIDLGGSTSSPQMGDPVAALPYLVRARELAEREGQVRSRLPNAKTMNLYRYSNQALVELSIARIYWYGLEQPEKAREHLDRAFELLRTPGVDLDNAEIRRKLMTTQIDYGALLLDLGQFAASMPYLRDARETTQKVALQDRQNLNARLDDALAEFYLGRGEALTGNHRGGFSAIDHSLNEFRESAAGDSADAFRDTVLYVVLVKAGDTALACGRVPASMAYYTEGSRHAQATCSAHDGDANARIYVSLAEHGLARCFAARQQMEMVRQHDKLAAAVKPVVEAHPGNAYARRLLSEATGR